MACLANLCQAVLATAQGRLAAAGEWVLNEKRLTERAGFDAIQDRLAQPGPDLGALVSDVRARLGLRDGVWAGPVTSYTNDRRRNRHRHAVPLEAARRSPG